MFFCRSFINIFSWRATGFHRRAKLLEMNFFVKKLSTRRSNQPTKIILTASQFAWCPTLNVNPVLK